MVQVVKSIDKKGRTRMVTELTIMTLPYTKFYQIPMHGFRDKGDELTK